MQFRVDTKALVQALKLVQPGLISSSHLSTYPNVVVNAQLGKIELSTWTGQEHFVASVASEVEEEGILAVDYRQLPGHSEAAERCGRSEKRGSKSDDYSRGSVSQSDGCPGAEY